MLNRFSVDNLKENDDFLNKFISYMKKDYPNDKKQAEQKGTPELLTFLTRLKLKALEHKKLYVEKFGKDAYKKITITDNKIEKTLLKSVIDDFEQARLDFTSVDKVQDLAAVEVKPLNSSEEVLAIEIKPQNSPNKPVEMDSPKRSKQVIEHKPDAKPSHEIEKRADVSRGQLKSPLMFVQMFAKNSTRFDLLFDVDLSKSPKTPHKDADDNTPCLPFCVIQ